ncbi:tripartite tricarboxylate transporter substrate binding protein [Rubrivivax sp. RP6-9]|uniref:tripartite tricarboxylate transporter substrate binding protein n=1 Tax=Rubrivivax sp. RP6-9 TaxID=3415750 RepID=UPI003CC6BE1B
MRPSPTRRAAIGAFTACVAVCAAATALPAAAQDYPSRPVRIIVPFAPGGSADVFGRAIAQRLQESLGQNFVVENRPGGGSVIGSDAVAKSAPDGYTLLVMSNTHTVNESLLPNKPFQLMRDFVPVAPINYSDLVLVAKAGLPQNNLRELVAAAKARPGGMSYASSGPGTPYHMAGELFKHMAGIDVVHVPYKGSGGARTDVLGGQLEMMFDAIPTMAEQVKAGKVKAIATTGRVRSTVLPDVPTMSEAGVPGYEATIWLGVVAPKGTPAAVVAKLNAEIGKITGNAELRRAWAAQGTTAMTMGVDEFTRYMNDDIAKWAGVVKAAGIKVD